MSENASMSANIIPAGESGEFRITDQMLIEVDGVVTMEAFEVLLREEARKRNLDISVQDDFLNRSRIVRWRPARHANTPV